MVLSAKGDTDSDQVVIGTWGEMMGFCICSLKIEPTGFSDGTGVLRHGVPS